MSNVIPLSARYIQETDLFYEVDKLKTEALEMYAVYQRDQINLRKPSNIDDMLGITYGSGSLYSREKGNTIDHDENWNSYIKVFQDLFITKCIKDIEHYVWKNYRYKIGRARLMRMKPKTCLSYHKDDSSKRIHVPIITNENCFFVNNDMVGKMLKTGYVYVYDVNSKHTAVNASREDRIHLVINCFSQQLNAA